MNFQVSVPNMYETQIQLSLCLQMFKQGFGTGPSASVARTWTVIKILLSIDVNVYALHRFDDYSSRYESIYKRAINMPLRFIALVPSA